MPGPLTTALAVCAVTALTRLPPGALTVAAARLACERGMRGAVTFMGGALLAETIVVTLVIGGVGTMPWGVLSSSSFRALTASLGLGLAGAILLWPGERRTQAATGALGDAGGLALAGFTLAMTTPGLWSWWGTVGLATLATALPQTGAIGLAAALVGGSAASHAVLAVALGAGAGELISLPPVIRRWMAAVLFGGAVLVAVLWLFAAQRH